MSVSIGIAIPPSHGRTVSELLRRADLALYHAKSQGRSRSAVFDLSMESDQLELLPARTRPERSGRAKRAVAGVPAQGGPGQPAAWSGIEALVRWNHPTRGQTPPATFISLAERSDQIVQIDRWVMRDAIETQARWREQGLAPLPIAINLSMADILSTKLVGLPERAARRIPGAGRRARGRGHRVGGDARAGKDQERAGRAEPARHRDHAWTISAPAFPRSAICASCRCRRIKIDQSFTFSMLKDPNAEKLTQAIVAMGLALKMRVVAEGVETRAADGLAARARLPPRPGLLLQPARIVGQHP